MSRQILSVWIGWIVVFATPVNCRAADGWLDGDANAIWRRSPGFYKEDNDWYAIIHVKPTATRVRLAGEFTNWDEHAVDLTHTPDGKFWWLKGGDDKFSRAPKAGDKYKFIVNAGEGSEDQWFQDPAARRVENSGLGSSSIVTVSSDYHWRTSGWSPPEWKNHLIYQLHPLRFTDRNEQPVGHKLPPLAQVTEELDADGHHDYLNHVGATTVQLLPINEFAGDLSWGYNPSFFYAVEASYGSPDDLKQLVDTAHKNGLAVILDVVYNHGGTGDNILWQIAQDDMRRGTYYDGDTQWGALVNFDDDVARHFFVQNIAFLAREYRVDGFRFDFTRPIHNEWDGNIKERGTGGGWRFLREVRASAKSVNPGIVFIAEELPNTWYVTREEVESEFASDRHGPFDSQWSDPFHDQFKGALKGGDVRSVYDAFTNFGDSWQDATIYAESHDEVGNTDDRIARRAREGKGWEMCQVAAAGSILGRGIPMVFMGQEAGEWMQFGQDDKKLQNYNPGTGNTWWDDRLPLTSYENDSGRKKLRDFYRKMFEIRKADPDSFAWAPIAVSHANDDNGVVAFTRGDGKYLIVLNFKGNSWENYNVGVSGRYRELANTSWPAFNVNGAPERTRGGEAAHDLTEVPVPPYGAVVLRRDD
jgi:1,4-alpha-glucan branching enzyme